MSGERVGADHRTGSPRGKHSVIYSLDQHPSPLLWPVFGAQQTLLCISGVLAAPILIANQVGAGDSTEVRSQLLSISLFTCGVATLLQNILGSRLPIIQGANTSFIAPIAAIFSIAKWSDASIAERTPGENGTLVVEPWMVRMREIQGDLMLASATEVVLGACGLVGFLLRFIGPLTVGPTIALIGLYIAKFVLPLCEQHWGLAFMSMALVLIFSLFLARFRIPLLGYSRAKGCYVTRYPLFELTPVILAVGLTWLVSYILTVTDTLPSDPEVHGHQARTDVRLSALQVAPWFSFPRPFPFGLPTVSAAGYVGMMTGTISTIIESTGDYFACARVAGVIPPPPHAVNRGIAMEGFSSVIGGLIGGVCASTSYSENIGAIAVTKVASRFVFVTAAVILILSGVIGKIGAVFTIIPDPIIGGVSLVTLGMVTSVGVSTLQFVDLSSSRNLMIIGVAMLLGLKLPDWMEANPGIIKTGSEDVDQIIAVLLTTPMFVAGFVGCFLDNTVPGSDAERGIKKWRQSMSGSDVTYVTGEETYEIPFITRFIRRVRCCSYFPLSPTFDKEITCTCCCKRRSRAQEYALENPVALEENAKV